MKKAFRAAFPVTVPVLLGYLFVGLAFGVLLRQGGYGPLWAAGMSAAVYAGSMQFVMLNFLGGGFSLVQVALMTLAVNFRHLFYGLSFTERFRQMGKKRWYMIYSLTDETYSLLCSQRAPEGVEQGTIPGLYKQFNVIYILADEEDLFGLRTTYRKEDMYLYRINIDRENLKKAFLGFAEKINSLHERPRYYNTVTANCTTELVDTFKNYLGVRRWQWTPVFNGMCDQDAYDRGELLHLPGENFRELKKRSFLGHGGEGLDWAALRRRWEEGWRTE